MTSVTVGCPYCSTESTVSIPDDTEIEEVSQSYETGIWGHENISEGTCAEGHHFGIRYR